MGDEECRHSSYTFDSRANGWEQRTCMHCSKVWLAEIPEPDQDRPKVLMQAIGYQVGAQTYELLAPAGAVARYGNGTIILQHSDGESCGIDGIVQVRMVAV